MQSVHKIKLNPSAGWIPPGMSIISNPICGVHGQDLQVQSWMWVHQGVQFGSFKVSTVLFVDYVVLLVSSDHNLQCILGRFATKCKVTEMTVNLYKVEVLNQKTVEWSFKCLGVLFSSNGRTEQKMDQQIRALSE